MVDLVGIAGSLRKGSFNRALLRAARDVMPEGAKLEILSIDDVPLYNGDVERSGIPEVVVALKNSLERARGLVLATPEYNGGIPGVLKNVIDWMSRPDDDIPRVFYDKPVALIGATPGGFGTAFSQLGWLQILRRLRMRVWVAQGAFHVSGARKLFDDSGLSDAETRDRLQSYMAAFVEHVQND